MLTCCGKRGYPSEVSGIGRTYPAEEQAPKLPGGEASMMRELYFQHFADHITILDHNCPIAIYSPFFFRPFGTTNNKVNQHG